MSRKEIAAIITSLVGIGIILYYMAVVYAGDPYRIMGGAVVMAVEIAVMIVVSIIVTSTKGNKDIGQGILIGSGVTLLVGFGICTGV